MAVEIASSLADALLKGDLTAAVNRDEMAK